MSLELKSWYIIFSRFSLWQTWFEMSQEKLSQAFVLWKNNLTFINFAKVFSNFLNLMIHQVDTLMTQHTYYSIKYITLKYLVNKWNKWSFLKTHLYFTNILIWINWEFIQFWFTLINLGYIWNQVCTMHFSTSQLMLSSSRYCVGLKLGCGVIILLNMNYEIIFY